MIGVFLSFLFDAKVVSYKVEGYGVVIVAPQAQCIHSWVIAELSKVMLEVQSGDESGLR